ncbi:MAG: ATP-binding protein, partial [Bacteroidota bacterium]|nr:ATP-binding protein [Bacteroidota bacterium]
FNIQGYLHTLLEGGMDDPTINKSYLEKAAKNADRLQTIIEDMEVIARLEANMALIEYNHFDIKNLIQDVFDEQDIKAKEKGIRMQFKEGADGSFMVYADKELIRLVLGNLINNSIKYGKQNGITKVSFYDLGREILVEVTDNGLGIDEHHIKYLFDRFYRVDKSRSREQGGSGLGLSIVKHIIESHGQRVFVRSTLELGSTFGFTIRKVI